MSDSLQPYGLWPARLLCPWDSLVKNTEVGCRTLLRGSSSPTAEPGSPEIPASQAGSLPPEHLGSPLMNIDITFINEIVSHLNPGTHPKNKARQPDLLQEIWKQFIRVKYVNIIYILKTIFVKGENFPPPTKISFIA